LHKVRSLEEILFDLDKSACSITVGIPVT